jgi:hypothetical protein
MNIVHPSSRIALGLIGVVILLLGSTASAFGQSVSCNLAPNAAFEQGTASSISQWSFYPGNGIGTFSVSSYPSPVQSGSRAAKISVTQSGDMVFHTQEPGTIAVYPNVAYKLSVRVKSDPGKIAGLRVIEWSGSSSVADRFLPYNTGTGDWETVEGSFTTTAQTTALSIRLSHHVPGAAGTGTFYWDDVMLWQDCPNRCADVRHYIGQATPGIRLCSDSVATFCMDGVKTAGGEYLHGASNTDEDYFSHTLAGKAHIGIQKTYGGGSWRCFSNRGEACGAARTSPGQNAEFPPQPLSISLNLPVLPAPGTSQRTAGAALIHDWQILEVRGFDPATGTSGALIGDIWGRTWAYLLSSYNFGGTIGVQNNVLVVEGESMGDGFCHDGFGGGSRFERYMYARGLGLLYAEGRDNIACGNSPTAANCNGVYLTLDPPVPLTLSYKIPGDLSIVDGAPSPFDIVNWW